MRIIPVLIIGWLLLPFQLQAQDLLYTLQFNGGMPVRDLQNKVGTLFFPELNLAGYYQAPFKPIEVGINLGYSIYGKQVERRNDLFASSNQDLRIRRNNNLLTFMGVFRYTFELDARVIPFIEVQMGANYFYTRYKIRETRFAEPFEQGRDFSDWVLGYRGGGGIKIPFKNPQKGYSEIRLLYHESGPVSFLRRQDTSFDPNTRTFDYHPTRSPFQLLQLGFGVVMPIYSED